MNNDTPITEESEDRLRFGTIAEQLSNALAKDELAGGFVIGVEGSWGSGKSSLINLALKKLKESENVPLIIEFSPWIVGNRNELLQQLFVEFKAAIRRKQGPAGFKIYSLLEQYGKIASPLASIAEVAEILVPGTGMICKGIRAMGEAASKTGSRSLSELNSQICKELEQFEQNIIVFIDDIDRLEPEESIEVLRLVRAVANFPRVIYLLAYDAKVLASALEGTINVPDGKAYLDKIVQASFRMPVSDKFDLTNWMKHEIKKIFDTDQMDSNSRQDLSSSIETWCDRFISTPRDVIRVLNAIRLYVVPQKSRIYLADAIFLQITRMKCPALHDWIEEYLLGGNAPADKEISTGELASLNDSQLGSIEKNLVTASMNDRLDRILSEIVGNDADEKIKVVWALRHHLPGLDTDHNEPRHGHEYSQMQISEFSSKCRLVSPYHFRLYFAFSVRSGDLSDDEVLKFPRWCIEDRQEARNRFIKLSETFSPQGVMMGELLLGRILDRGNQLPQNEIENFLLFLGDSIDDLVKNSTPDSGHAEFVSGNKDQIIGLIKYLGPNQRNKVLEALFNKAKSLTWLSGILWSSVQQRGYSGFEGLPKGEWLLTHSEYQLACNIFVDRIKKEEPEAILETPPPYLLLVLDVWCEIGAKSDVLEWVECQSSDDLGFVNLLSKMTTWENSTNIEGEYTIRTETLKKYFKIFDMGRLEDIEKDDSHDQKIREKASQLLEKIESFRT